MYSSMIWFMRGMFIGLAVLLANTIAVLAGGDLFSIVVKAVSFIK